MVSCTFEGKGREVVGQWSILAWRETRMCHDPQRESDNSPASPQRVTRETTRARGERRIKGGRGGPRTKGKDLTRRQ